MIVFSLHPVFPEVSKKHAFCWLDIYMEAIWFVPEQNFVVFGNLYGFKPSWVDVSCCLRIYVYIFFDMNHFFRVLMEEISRKVDMAEIDKIVMSGV